MRNCGNCGYLLPPTWDTCKKCGAPVGAAAPAPAPAPVAAAVPAASGPTSWSTPAPPPHVAPPQQYGAPATSGYDPRYAAPTGAAYPPPPAYGGYAPVRTAPQRKSKSPYIILVVVAALIGSAYYGLQVLRRPPPLPDEAVAYIDGGGVTHAPVNQGYSARFPMTPVETSESASEAGVTMTVTLALSSVEGKYEVGVGSMDMGMVLPVDQIDYILDGAVDGIVAEEPGTKLVEQTRLDFLGVPAIEATMTAPDGFEARALVLVNGTRVYMLVTHATERNDDLFVALRDSFQFA